MTQCAGRVADQRDRLAGSNHRLEQLDRGPILCQIPHRAVAAGVEDRIVVLNLAAVEANRCNGSEGIDHKVESAIQPGIGSVTLGGPLYSQLFYEASTRLCVGGTALLLHNLCCKAGPVVASRSGTTAIRC